jgi:hypothetical protein
MAWCLVKHRDNFTFIHIILFTSLPEMCIRRNIHMTHAKEFSTAAPEIETTENFGGLLGEVKCLVTVPTELSLPRL